MRNKEEHKKNTIDNLAKDLDQLLENSDLTYSSLNFKNSSGDILKSYKELNKKIGKTPNYFQNIKNILPAFNFNLILKPIYTMVLTAIVIFTVIELKDTGGVKYAEINVDKGEKIQLYVTDEIKIWVNSKSTIKIPLEIKRNSSIYLSGEAFFEIDKKRRKTVKVISEGIEIEASKASFNVKSDTKTLITTIKSGEVEYYNPKLPKSTTLDLFAKDRALYYPDLEFIAVEQEQSMNYLSWHTGHLKFDHTPLYKAVKTISTIYEIPIAITNQKISMRDFNAQFENADIDDILDKIQSTYNCQISADGSKIIIY